MRTTLAFLVAAQVGLFATLVLGQSPATTLRVASITLAPDQPQQQDKAVILYEDFDQLPDWRSRYFEYVPEKESFVWTPDVGLHGGAMRCQFDKGQVSAGSLKVLFGQNPFGRGFRRDETFRDIYWRVYVKHEPGWEAGSGSDGPRLARHLGRLRHQRGLPGELLESGVCEAAGPLVRQFRHQHSADWTDYRFEAADSPPHGICRGFGLGSPGGDRSQWPGHCLDFQPCRRQQREHDRGWDTKCPVGCLTIQATRQRNDGSRSSRS